MRAVGLVFAAKCRRHRRSWLLLSVFVAIGTGLVLAPATAGRRADSAFPRFVASYGYDAIVYSGRPLPDLAKLPEVARVTTIRMPFYGHPRCSCQRRINEGAFGVREVPPASLGQVVKLISGRMPDQSSPHEALASFTLQRDYDIGPGTVIRLPMAAASQWQAVLRAMAGGPVPKPAGPTIALRVVGIGVAESEFPSGQTASYDLYPTRAFAAATRGTPALPVYYVRLRHGQAGFARFEAKASGLNGAGVQDLDRPAAAITAAIHPQAVGWWVLSALAGLAAIAAIGQALARQAASDSADYPDLAALGMQSWQLAAVSMLRTLAVALPGAAGGVVLATLLSPLAPVGEARLADPSPGLVFDWPVLGLGAVAAIVLVLAVGVPPALRSARMRGVASPLPAHPSAVARAIAAAGAPAGAVIGVRHALERGSGERRIPVGTALAGTVIAVTALCATAVFGTSLSHLIGSPELYGAPFQVYFNASGPGADPERGLLAELERDPAIDRITRLSIPAVSVNHVSVRALAASPVRGAVLLSAVEGRLPAREREVALGVSTMRRVGAHIGSTVSVSVTSPRGVARSQRFQVVGLVSFPGDFGTGGLGSGVALTTAGYVAAQCPVGPGQPECLHDARGRADDVILVHAMPGAAGSAALSRHIRQHRGNVSHPTEPASLVNFGESANFPLLLGGAVAICGAATLAHLLVVSVARRRTESGLLKAIGMVRRQVAGVVFWQATTVAIIGTAAGVPLGIAAGRAIWRAFAINLGAVAVPAVRDWLIVTLATGILVAANVLAIFPAVSAARSQPGQILRAE
ncbi:MAG TPA: FtsX-like permease family protein [Streptosporangiaceae bacterium]